MNLYVRYFDDETVVPGVKGAVNFLQELNIPDFNIDQNFVDDLQAFVDSSITFPKRYKVHARYYFIVIKTNAETLDEFKMNNSKSVVDNERPVIAFPKKVKGVILSEEIPGWYDGQLDFKRVIAIPGTGKFQYKDTVFRALVKAVSPLDCYNRILGYIRNRGDVDERSQFPSPKGRNFVYTYLGVDRPSQGESQ